MEGGMEAAVDIRDGREELAHALAERVRAAAAEAAAARGRFCLAIPGGSVLGLLADGLAGGGAVDARDWELFWTDERAVPADDPDSNARAARETLLPRLRLPSGRIHPMEGGRGAEEGAQAYEAELAQAFRLGPDEWPRFDLVLLGVGEDGHVASLFPGSPALRETRRRAAAAHDAPKPPPDRITLTLPVLNHARQILVVAAGRAKAPVVARVLAGGDAAAALPAARLRSAGGGLRWMLDRAAAADLAAKETP